MNLVHRRLLPLGPYLGLMLLLIPVTAGSAGAQMSPSPNAPEQSAGGGTENKMRSLDLTLEMDDEGSTAVALNTATPVENTYISPDLISASLGCKLEDLDVSRDEDLGTSTLEAKCDFPLHRSFLTRSGTIDLRPIKGIQSTEPSAAFVLVLSVPGKGSVRCEPAPERLDQDQDQAACLYLPRNSAETPASVSFQFGYSRAYAIRLVGILGSLLLLPIAFTFWFRRRALDAPDEAKTAVSFAYRRFISRTAIWGSLVWWTAMDLLHADDFVRFQFAFSSWNDGFMGTIFPWVLLWIPPTAVYFLCLSLSLPMRTLRGTEQTQKQILNESFWSVAQFVLPISLLVLGIAEIFNSPRIGVLLIAANVIAGKFATSRFARAHGLELCALNSGDLRDRAFAMAQEAKTKLHQLYILPAERNRTANACAHVAQNIFVTDYLIKNLNKSEVDAVVAHEITHLQRKHGARRMTAMYAAIFVLACAGGFFSDQLPHALPFGPICYALLLLALFLTSRRNEYVADAGSVKLTGNAEAMITALAKITRLNTMPMQWSKFDEKLLTHPSSLRRIKRLAISAGISEARTAELIIQSAGAPNDIYAIPTTSLPEGKLFSSRYKRQVAGRFAWAVLLTTVILPAVAAFAVRESALEGGRLWFAYSAGFFITIAADLALFNFMPMLGVSRLETNLREKCHAQNANAGTCEGLFVALAPESTPRVYEGNWAWDIGFLSLSNERLTYWGEEAQFDLRRDEITSLSTGPGAAGWFRARSVYVSWRDSSDREGTFNLQPWRGRSMGDLADKTLVLARDLENWRRSSSPDSRTILLTVQETAKERLGVPTFGQVTGLLPRTLLRGKFLARDFMLNTFLAIGVILVFGLGFPPLDDLARGSALMDLKPALGGLYVLAVVWVTRVLILMPYWRTRETSAKMPS